METKTEFLAIKVPIFPLESVQPRERNRQESRRSLVIILVFKIALAVLDFISVSNCLLF